MAVTVGKHRSETNSIRQLQVRQDRAKSKIEPKISRIELYKENMK